MCLSVIPRAMQKKYATGRPDQKDLNENLAATQGLARMIVECNRLFEVPGVELMEDVPAGTRSFNIPGFLLSNRNCCEPYILL